MALLIFLGATDMTDSKTPPVPVSQPRGMSVIAAAKYWGVSPGTFRKLVRLGIAPAPLKLPEIDRNVFDRLAIDAAMSARSVQHGAVES
jgi:hypothetical protein